MRKSSCLLLLAVLIAPHMVPGEDWQSELHRWALSSQGDPACKVRYVTGIYRPDLGDEPVWGVMTEKMFKFFSGDGAKLAPSVCPVTRATLDKAEYRLLFSVTPMRTITQTTHGSETRTASEPFNANVTYSDGTTATVQGQQTTTVVVPTETTISRSSVALYMYAYRVDAGQLALISTDEVVFSRVAASGSGANAAGAELGAGIGNAIRASKDRHRADKLFKEALNAVVAAQAEPVPVHKAPVADQAHAASDAAAGQAAHGVATQPEQSSTSTAAVRISSTPDGADIEIDGNYVGSTPSTVGLSPGQHEVSVKKTGFKPWERKISVSTGEINVNATLDADAR